MTSEDALTICRNATPTTSFDTSEPEPNGIELGCAVTVRAIDYGRDPVDGRLVESKADEIVILRKDDRAGEVYVHFPRVGYEMKVTGSSQ